MSGAARREAGRLPALVEAVDVTCTKDQVDANANNREPQPNGIKSDGAASKAPTLRRVALLNTLVFLGLALSNSEIHAGQAAAATSPSRQHPIGDHHRGKQQDSQTVGATGLFQPGGDELIDNTHTYQQLQEIFEEDEQPPLKQNDYPFEETSSHSESSDSFHKDVIIVATVDGTMAAIDSSNGKVLWKQAGEGSREHYQNRRGDDNHDGMSIPHMIEEEEEGGKASPRKLLQPLIATSTTAKSSRHSSRSESSKTVAIPSIDGSVYLTTPGHITDGDTRPTSSSMSTTVVSSLRELVARVPYVDSNGRFYVGSRHATAAAIDGDTGEILYLAAADGDDDRSNNSDPKWEGRNNVVWIGRVDYSVSVYNARTSAKEVRFSAAEIMSVNDMYAGQGQTSSKATNHHYQEALSTNSEQAPNLMLNHDEQFFDTAEFEDAAPPPQLFSELVSTPSGNVAYRNPRTGQLEWVADEIFETPIAYAIKSSTGDSLNIDIIPDVTMPSQSKEYLTKEIERQIEATSQDCDAQTKLYGASREPLQPPIVGTLLSGQLYAMPLGRRRSKSHSSSSPSSSTWTESHRNAIGAPTVYQHHSVASTSSSAPLNPKHTVPKKTPAVAHRNTNALDERQVGGNVHNKICSPSKPTFPGCLFKAVSQLGAEQIHSIDAPPDGASNLGPVKSAYRLDGSAVGEYMPSYPQSFQNTNYEDVYQSQFRQRNYRKILRILGSWLPPTIALIFVVSFELGRRKRQKDTQGGLKQLNENNVLDCNDLLRAVDENGCRSDDASPRQVIQITDHVLGYGGHGTVVFRGMLEGRNVAVKRMLRTYLASADREISLLIESDGHPNVVRYFLKEVKGDFVYLALELCDLSLHNLIGTLVNIHKESKDSTKKLAEHCISRATKKLILQIANGVRHLHSLRIVHNDLKPANILLAVTKEAKTSQPSSTNESIYRTFQQSQYVAKISDMGLGKMLAGQSSLGGSTLADISNRGQSHTEHAHSNVGIGPGTVGWMAPEAMRVKSSSALSTDISAISNSAEPSPMDRTSSTISRASRSVDIFSLGCIFYSLLVPGSHPFGEWYEREANIVHDQPDIESLKHLSVEAYDLVSAMLQNNPRNRPTAKQICEHPFFWSLQQKLSFVCELSDRLETDGASNEELSAMSSFAANPLAIERNATQLVGLAWDKVLDKDLISNVQRYRAYDPCSVRDLLRLIRNKHHHYDELPADVRQRIGTNTEGLMKYFESCFPSLLLHCYKVCREILSAEDPLVEKYSITTVGHKNSKQNIVKIDSSCIEPENAADYLAILPLVTEEAVSAKETSAETVPTTDEGQVESNATSEHLEPSLQVSDDDTKRSPDQVTLSDGGLENISSPLATTTNLQSPVDATGQPLVNEKIQDDIVLWEGSTAARAFNCRGWIRSDDEWTRRTLNAKKRNANLVRCADDAKFRTRLCNHWDTTFGTFCPMRRKNKCVFAHGPVELRVKEGKRQRWGKLVDKNGNNSNPRHSGGEDTYGAARSIESVRKDEGKWNTNQKNANRPKKQGTAKKKAINEDLPSTAFPADAPPS